MENFFKKGLAWKKSDVDYLIGKVPSFCDYSTLGYLTNDLTLKYEHILQELPVNFHIWNNIGIFLDECSDSSTNRHSIDNAIAFIKKHDSDCISNTIRLVRSLHILKNNDKDTDISFSDPAIPLSIFVSMPSSNSKFHIERLVENIIHESLHLQLTLIEKQENIYRENKEKIYSPWKNEPRSNVGILHAVYVFSKLKYFWCKVENDCQTEFSKSRVETITNELEKINRDDIIYFYTERGNHLLNCCLKSVYE